MCHKGDVSMLIDMEQTVLNILDFQLQLADPIFFLNRLMLYDDNGSSQEVNIDHIYPYIIYPLIIYHSFDASSIIRALTVWTRSYTI